MTTTQQRLPSRPFTVDEALSFGISRRTLYRLVDRGVLDQLGPGVFQRGDVDHDDANLIDAVTRAPQATICLASALVHHDLVDLIPAKIDLAVPRGHHLPHGTPLISWHRFDAATFTLGRTTIEVKGARHPVGLYEPARAICDVFRLRGLEGYETGIEALRTWLGRRGSNPAELMSIAAQLPRAAGPVRTALEHLA